MIKKEINWKYFIDNIDQMFEDELYDKNGKNWMVYQKLNSDNPPIEIFLKKEIKLVELYIKGEPEIPSAQLLNKKWGKLSGNFNYDKKGIEDYDKDGNKLDKLGAEYKKEETGVEPIVGEDSIISNIYIKKEINYLENIKTRLRYSFSRCLW